MPFQKGNQLASNALSFNAALRRVINKKNLSRKEKMDVLEEMANILIDKALEGSESTISHLADRLDGKPQQAVQLSGDADSPLTINIIRYSDKNP